MIAVVYRIVISPTAGRLLSEIRDQRVLLKLRERIDGLAFEPEQQGKPMTGQLLGYRSLRAVGQRYRILYRVDRRRVEVHIVIVGLRKEGDRNDVYALAAKLIRLGLL